MRNLFIILAFLCLQTISAQEKPNDFLYARSQMQKQAYDSALYYLDVALIHKPNDTEARMNRGICYMELGQYEKARSEFLLVNKQRNGKASLLLAKTEIKLKHPDLAVKYLREHLQSPYKLPEKDLLLDEDFFELQNTNGWKNLWKEKDWYNQYDKELQEALYELSNDNILDAVNLLNDLDKKGFKKSKVNLLLARIYSKSGNIKAAQEALEKAYKSDSRNIEALKLRIEIFNETEQFEKAKLDCDRLLRLAPDEFDYYLTVAKINSNLGEYNQALEKIEFYLNLFPLCPKAYNELGEIHFENKKYLLALSAFNKTLDLDKGNPTYYFNRGRTYAATKTYKYAERDFSMALDLDPLNPDIWFQKGVIDLAMGNKNTACFNFNKALQYGKFEASEYIEQNCSK